MKKTGVKSFLCSFILSLFIIFTVNSAFLHTSEKQNIDIKIPSKNVALFLKNSRETGSSRVKSVKKIALSAPEKKLEPKVVSSSEIIPLSIGESEEINIASIEEVFDVEIPEEPKITVVSEAKDVIPEFIPIDREIVVAEVVDKIEPHVIPLEKSSDKKVNDKIIIAKDTDRNQLAMAKSNFSTKEITENIEPEVKEEKAPESKKKWEKMSEKQSDPWVVAKGAKFPTNNAVLDADYNKDEAEIKAILAQQDLKEANSNGTQLAADLVQNILIPIPEDIMNEEDITPNLSLDKDKKEPEVVEEIKEAIKTEDENEESVLKGLTSIFSKKPNADEKQVGASEQLSGSVGFFDQITGKNRKKAVAAKILPTEMRLSFQPNRAEISGQTLKWIHAFAKKATDEENVILEVRINGTVAEELQRKRLNLLRNILISKGTDLGKVNIIFTDREPNSFIIRTLRINNSEANNDKANKAALYY